MSKLKVGDVVYREMICKIKTDTRATRKKEKAIVVGLYRRHYRVRFVDSGIYECYLYEEGEK